MAKIKAVAQGPGDCFYLEIVMVTESVLRIPLDDLKTIRVKCAKCGAVTEGPCSSNNNRMVINNQCGACGQKFHGNDRQLFEFVSQIEQIQQLTTLFSVEFVIPDPDVKAL